MNKYTKIKQLAKMNKPFSDYAFSLFLFTKRLVKDSISSGMTDLFFLSREGRFLKQLYDYYVSVNSITNCPKSHYFYVSRKAVMNSTLQELETEKFTSLKVYHRLSVEKFLKALNFECEDISKVKEELQEDIKTEHINFFCSDVFFKLMESKQFRSIYEQKRIIAQENFQTYLVKSGYRDAERLALVDVGWNGTMQNHLFTMGMHDTLVGYYIGVRPSKTPDPNNIKNGVLFNTTSSVHEFSHFCHNYEYVCVANHGGVSQYDNDGNPVLNEDEDVALYNEIFSEVQQSLFEKFKMMCDCFSSATYNERQIERYCTFKHVKMLGHLSKKEREILRIAIANHPDNLADIRPRKTLKTRLFLFKRFTYIKMQCLKYCFWFI